MLAAFQLAKIVVENDPELRGDVAIKAYVIDGLQNNSDLRKGFGTTMAKIYDEKCGHPPEKQPSTDQTSNFRDYNVYDANDQQVIDICKKCILRKTSDNRSTRTRGGGRAAATSLSLSPPSIHKFFHPRGGQ